MKATALAASYRSSNAGMIGQGRMTPHPDEVRSSANNIIDPMATGRE